LSNLTRTGQDFDISIEDPLLHGNLIHDVFEGEFCVGLIPPQLDDYMKIQVVPFLDA